MRHPKPRVRAGAFLGLLWSLALTSVLATLGGCGGGSGPQRYPVSGSVTYDGKPVPAGRIYFEPDGSRGNQGPAGYAEIEQGRYDTSDGGKGVVGGAHKVRIEGYDGKPAPANDHHPRGTRLFVHHGEAVLPEKAVTRDFAVESE